MFYVNDRRIAVALNHACVGNEVSVRPAVDVYHKRQQSKACAARMVLVQGAWSAVRMQRLSALATWCLVVTG